MTPQQKRLLASVGLVDLSLLLLWAGGLIQFDGSADSDDWILPVCFLGFLAVGGAVVLSWPDRGARRAVGLTLVVVAVAMVVFGTNVEGFRFVYAPFEAEYVAITVGIALLGILLAAPFRVFAYAVAAVVAAVIGLRLGDEGGEIVCGPDTSCALADSSGLFVAGVMALLVLIVAAVIESRRAAYRRLPKRDSAGREGQR